MRKSITLLFLFCTAIFAQQKGTFTDPRDGKKYRTVKIGEQTWMAENLNYNASGSKCYDNEPANCDKYGRLYNWATAMGLDKSCNSSSCASQITAKHRGICPAGWHIPSNDDWDEMMTAVGDSSIAGRYLKATSGWTDYNGSSGGLDTYGFVALPGGYALSDGYFSDVDDYGCWWSASEYDEGNANNAYNRNMNYFSESAYWSDDYKYFLHSVRCVGD